MLLLGLLFSQWMHSSSRSLTSAILTWLILVFLFPRLGSAAMHEIASLRYDPKKTERAVAALVQERDRKTDAVWDQENLLIKRSVDSAPVVDYTRNQGVLHRFGSARFYDALAKYYAKNNSLGILYAERIFAVRQLAMQQMYRLRQLGHALSYPSPAFLLERLAESFAGTSLADHERFLAESRAYRRHQFIPYLESKQALCSWRWFTDDPSQTNPWTLYLDLSPEDLDPSEKNGEPLLRELARRFEHPDIQARVSREKAAFQTDPSRLLELDDFPPFKPRQLTFLSACRRIAPEMICLIALTIVLTWINFSTFKKLGKA